MQENSQVNFADIAKDVVALGMVVRGRLYSLPSGRKTYFQIKGVSSGLSGKAIVDSVGIGYLTDNFEFIIRVNICSYACSFECREIE